MRTNIFILGPEGRALIGPMREGERGLEKGRFGAVFLKQTFGLSLPGGSDLLANFIEQEGPCRELKDPFDLHLLAVPVKLAVHGGKTVHLVMGPIIIDKPWPDGKYLGLAQQLGLTAEGLLEEFHSVPLISRPAASAVLNLLSEVIKDIFDLDLEKQKLSRLQAAADPVPRGIADAARDIFTAIQEDELLVMVLDEAVKISQAEGGSIMLLDEKKGELSIRVSRGLENKKSILQSRLKVGEGIAGKAAQDKMSMIIHGTEGDAAIRHMLNRPEIKTSLVVPLLVKEKVVGVLNLYTKTADTTLMQHAAADIEKLSAFVATAIRSL